MSITDETGICNLALDLLAEAPIASLADDRRIARWCARNYDTARDSLLRKAPWRFAIKLAELPAATAPVFGWANAYDLPADCLRALPLTVNGAPEGAIIASEVIGRRLETDAAAPLRLRYIFRNTDVADYPADFVEALSAALAMKMAHWLTGKSGYFQIAQTVWREALNNAVLTDAIEGTIAEPDASAWIAERLA
jgi:hypothetical protein